MKNDPIDLVEMTRQIFRMPPNSLAGTRHNNPAADNALATAVAGADLSSIDSPRDLPTRTLLSPATARLLKPSDPCAGTAMLCPCGEEVDFEPPYRAEKDTNIKAWHGGWLCPKGCTRVEFEPPVVNDEPPDTEAPDPFENREAGERA